jgi:hypothetical protein
MYVYLCIHIYINIGTDSFESFESMNSRPSTPSIPVTVEILPPTPPTYDKKVRPKSVSDHHKNSEMIAPTPHKSTNPIFAFIGGTASLIGIYVCMYVYLYMYIYLKYIYVYTYIHMY